jgi:chemotaxis signal transduction protein
VDAADFRSGKYLTFRLAGREFAIDATRVKGIVPMHVMEFVEPEDGASSLCLGRATLQGQAFEVLDLARWLGLARGAQGRNAYILAVETAVESHGRIVGFPVDRVGEVVVARAHDFSSGKIRIGRPRRVLDADRLFDLPP